MLVSIIRMPRTGTKAVVCPEGKLTKAVKNYLDRIGMKNPKIISEYPEKKGLPHA